MVNSSEPVEVRSFEPGDSRTVIGLWETCGLTRSWNDPAKDIARKVAVGDDMFLVAAIGDTVVGTVMAGYDGHRGWINYLAVHPDQRGWGIGRVLMGEAEHRLRLVGCPKINLQVRSANATTVGFYENLGYATDEVVSLGKRIERDD